MSVSRYGLLEIKSAVIWEYPYYLIYSRLGPMTVSVRQLKDTTLDFTDAAAFSNDYFYIH